MLLTNLNILKVLCEVWRLHIAEALLHNFLILAHLVSSCSHACIPHFRMLCPPRLESKQKCLADICWAINHWPTISVYNLVFNPRGTLGSLLGPVCLHSCLLSLVCSGSLALFLFLSLFLSFSLFSISLFLSFSLSPFPLPA